MSDSEIIRCEWCLSHPLSLEYHDREWGVPKADDRDQFEHLILETFQAGLSWLTILKKRDALREDFADFDAAAVAEFGEAEVMKLMQDARIIRSEAKIRAAIGNAARFLEVVDEFGSFNTYLGQFRPQTALVCESMSDIPGQTAESVRFAKDMKQRGFKFIGPVSGYAHMQSVGLVNDHVRGCFRFAEIEALRNG